MNESIESSGIRSNSAPPPCFFFRFCGRAAEFEKAGKSVCSACAAHLIGRVYPLRNPTPEPLYASARSAARACGMLERDPRRVLARHEPLRRTLVEVVRIPAEFL